MYSKIFEKVRWIAECTALAISEAVFAIPESIAEKGRRTGGLLGSVVSRFAKVIISYKIGGWTEISSSVRSTWTSRCKRWIAISRTDGKCPDVLHRKSVSPSTDHEAVNVRLLNSRKLTRERLSVSQLIGYYSTTHFTERLIDIQLKSVKQSYIPHALMGSFIRASSLGGQFWSGSRMSSFTSYLQPGPPQGWTRPSISSRISALLSSSLLRSSNLLCCFFNCLSSFWFISTSDPRAWLDLRCLLAGEKTRISVNQGLLICPPNLGYLQ